MMPRMQMTFLFMATLFALVFFVPTAVLFASSVLMVFVIKIVLLLVFILEPICILIQKYVENIRILLILKCLLIVITYFLFCK